jgi:hypothetical protein
MENLLLHVVGVELASQNTYQAPWNRVGTMSERWSEERIALASQLVEWDVGEGGKYAA